MCLYWIVGLNTNDGWMNIPGASPSRKYIAEWIEGRALQCLLHPYEMSLLPLL
jgi:hypothetical protein